MIAAALPPAPPLATRPVVLGWVGFGSSWGSVWLYPPEVVPPLPAVILVWKMFERFSVTSDSIPDARRSSAVPPTPPKDAPSFSVFPPLPELMVMRPPLMFPARLMVDVWLAAILDTSNPVASPPSPAVASISYGSVVFCDWTSVVFPPLPAWSENMPLEV